MHDCMAHYVPNSSRSIRCTWHTPDLRPQLFLPRTGSVCGCLIAHQSVQSRLMQQEPHNREVQCSASRSSPQVAMLTRPNNAVCCTEPTFRVCHFSNIGHMQQHVHLYSRKPNSRGASRVVYCDNSLGSSRHQCGTNSITTASADAGGLTPGGTSSDSDSITPTPAGDSQSYASAVSSSGSGGGDNSSGRGGGSDGGSSGSSGDKPKFPVWYSVSFFAAATQAHFGWS